LVTVSLLKLVKLFVRLCQELLDLEVSTVLIVDRCHIFVVVLETDDRFIRSVELLRSLDHHVKLLKDDEFKLRLLGVLLIRATTPAISCIASACGFRRRGLLSSGHVFLSPLLKFSNLLVKRLFSLQLNFTLFPVHDYLRVKGNTASPEFFLELLYGVDHLLEQEVGLGFDVVLSVLVEVQLKVSQLFIRIN